MKVVAAIIGRASVRELLTKIIEDIDSGALGDLNDVVVVVQQKGGGIIATENSLTYAQVLFLLEGAKFQYMMKVGDWVPNPNPDPKGAS